MRWLIRCFGDSRSSNSSFPATFVGGKGGLVYLVVNKAEVREEGNGCGGVRRPGVQIESTGLVEDWICVRFGYI